MVVKHAPVEYPTRTKGATIGKTPASNVPRVRCSRTRRATSASPAASSRRSQIPRGDSVGTRTDAEVIDDDQNEAGVGQVLAVSCTRPLGDECTCPVGVESVGPLHQVGVSAGHRPLRRIRDRRPADDIVRGGPAVATDPSLPTSITAKIHSRGMRRPNCLSTVCPVAAASTSTTRGRLVQASMRSSAILTCAPTARNDHPRIHTDGDRRHGQGVIVQSQAIPRVLPRRECPGAVASAG
jgi:hypothetical protein